MRFRSVLAAILAACIASAAFASTPLPVVNVNTANETQLTYLPGVGDVLAGRIVEFIGGVETGKPRILKSADELLEVKGIGKKNLAQMCPYIVLSGPTTATAKIKTAAK